MRRSFLNNKLQIIFLVGPTGVGKTQVGLSLAHLIPCEMISADSMQVYRGMDIIADKLPIDLRRKYPHRLVDLISPAKEYNVSDFVKEARKSIAAILKKRKMPVVIGGTGLYVNSLLYGIFEAKAKDEKIREYLEAEADKCGLNLLYRRLERFDPEAAYKIDPSDKRRIIRALEVLEVAKTPISVLQKNKKGLIDEYPVHIFGLRRDRQDLYSRIEQRVDFMVNAGLLDEVRGLLEKKLSRTSYMCIGIRELEGFLKGRYDLAEAVRLMKQNSRRFAKRQLTWFNKNKDIKWIDIRKDEDLDQVAQKIYNEFEYKSSKVQTS